jgi:hypothetical protein
MAARYLALDVVAPATGLLAPGGCGSARVEPDWQRPADVDVVVR